MYVSVKGDANQANRKLGMMLRKEGTLITYKKKRYYENPSQKKKSKIEMIRNQKIKRRKMMKNKFEKRNPDDILLLIEKFGLKQARANQVSAE